LVSSHRDMNVQLPPCPTEAGEANTQEERLYQICRDHAGMYKEIFEKYHESVYSIATDILQKSQERQVKQMKALSERETSDVMRQLQLSRKNEVKQLALVHKDKDELER
jgi:phosphatidylinositol phospholipase C, beta